MNNSKKALQAALRDAAFDPRKPGPITTIVESNDPHYLIARAEEVLRDAKVFPGAEKRARVRSAVSILAYAMTLLPTASYGNCGVPDHMKNGPCTQEH